jgi:NitT/TauT family transport system substrate-binding protein
VRSAKDLEGQTVAVNGLKSTAECAVREWMRSNGADSTKARFVELPPPALVPAIVRGTVAAAMVSEPALSQGGDAIRILAKALDSVAKTFLLNSFAARKDWILANRQTAERFALAVADTARWSNSNHPATALTLAKYAKIDTDQLQHMNRVTFGEKLDPRLVQPVIDIALRYGTISRPVAASDIVARL